MWMASNDVTQSSLTTVHQVNNQWTSPIEKAALIEHTKRAAYQTRHVWGQMLVADPELLVLLQTLTWKKNETGGWDVQ